MNESNNRAAPAADRDFVITRTFDAPRPLVFQAWTDPQRMARWWGPRGFTNPVCKLDVQPGGAYRIVMRGADGTDYPINGVYREVVEPHRLVMTVDCSEHPAAWHDLVNPNRDKTQPPALESVQTVTFDAHGGQTKLTIRSSFESTATRDGLLKIGMNEGWSQSLDRLAEELQTAVHA